MPMLSISKFPVLSHGQSNDLKLLVESSVFWYWSLDFWLNETRKFDANEKIPVESYPNLSWPRLINLKIRNRKKKKDVLCFSNNVLLSALHFQNFDIEIEQHPKSKD